jgi:ribosomal protein L13
MTAKRFQYNVNKNCIECDGKFVAYVDMVDGFRIANKLTVLAEENEQLKTTIHQLRTDNTKQKKKLNTTMKENEHIKQTINDMINTERTELGRSVLKQLWEEIQ